MILKKVPYLPAEFCKELAHFSTLDLMDELPREAMSLKALAEVNDVEAALKSCEAPFLPLLEEGRCVSLLQRPALEKLLRKSPGNEGLMDVRRCAEPSGLQILEGTSPASLYPLFAQAHVQAACVVTASGLFCGIISRAGLAAKTTAIELEAQEKGLPGHHEDSEDTDESGDSDSIEMARQ